MAPQSAAGRDAAMVNDGIANNYIYPSNKVLPYRHF